MTTYFTSAIAASNVNPYVFLFKITGTGIFFQAQLDDMVKENNLLRDAFAEARHVATWHVKRGG